MAYSSMRLTCENYQFGHDMTLYLIVRDREYVTKQLNDVLPFAFDKDELESGTLG